MISIEFMTYYDLDRTMEMKNLLYVVEVAKGVLALPTGPFVGADVEVDIWKYRYYGKTFVSR